MQTTVDDDDLARRLVQLHSAGLPRGRGDPDDRHAHMLMLNADRSLPLNATIVRMQPSDIIDSQNMELRSVHWLMEKLKVYRPESEVVMGVRFPDGNILSHVLERRYVR